MGWRHDENVAALMENAPPQPEILQRIITLLRRDLKLGGEVRIAPDMPLFGGEFDLDSLDVLLLVTSIEKEFGIKIPSEAVGQEVFQNLRTLTAYIQENLNGSSTPDYANLLARLPHGEPFRFVTKVLNVRSGESAEGVWEITGTEDFFRGHFPGKPLVPGVLIAEALAQLSGLATPDAGPGMLAQVDVRFDAPVAPPAQIALRSKLNRSIGSLQQFQVSASVGDATVASGTITLHRGGPA